MHDPRNGQDLASAPSVELMMLSTKETESYSWLGIRSWGAYCDRHGYAFHVVREHLLPDMHPVWSKIEMVRRRLRSSDASHVLLVDADSAVYDPGRSLDNLLTAGAPLKFAADGSILGVDRWFRRLSLKFRAQRFHLPNAGFILIENSSYSQSFFDDWISLARGELAALADVHPRNQNVLWHGLLRQHSDNIEIAHNSVARVTHASQLPFVRFYKPLAVHFKHESVSAEVVDNFLKLSPASRAAE